MDFNNNGVIEPGLHSYSVNDFVNDFISTFSASQTRSEIFKNLINLLNVVSKAYKPIEIWLDGSYVTHKLNPNDIDFIIFLSLDDWIKLSNDVPMLQFIKSNPYLDVFVTIAVTDDSKNKLCPDDIQAVVNKRNYWRGQFGFDRNDIPKGIIVIQWDEIQQYMNGGGNNADVF